MNARIVTTYRDKDNNIITNPEEGQLAHSPETSKMYRYTNGEWEMIDVDGDFLQMSLYEINKQIVAQKQPIEKEYFSEKINLYVENTKAKYYMLLCKDLNYYTVFVLNETVNTKIADEVFECVSCLGEVKDVENQDAVEIWVQPEGEEPAVMYLFVYDEGVIECTL